jgi:thiamine biosynthesis protein ThiI
MHPVLIVHYHEIWLKGCNRQFFVQKLRQAIRQALGGLDLESPHFEDHRLVVICNTEEAREAALERLAKVPGIASIGVGVEAEAALPEIIETGARLMAGIPFQTFRVRCRRSRKNLPFRSREIEGALGQRINDDAKAAGRSIRVDLTRADATCYVEVTPYHALVYARKIPGVGGLPSGTAGKLACLLSGGFDSAVAAYKIMKRGVRLVFIHFHGAADQPGEDSPPVARRLVEALAPYQNGARLYLVPFSGVQRTIVAGAPDAFRILLYRRFMLRIAERLAYKEHARGLVTGDSIGQVASQTLHNMQAVGAVATLPLYRPLVGDDKQEILAVAKRIGTYDISSEPFTDCCPLYMPKSPEIFAKIGQLNEAEKRLDVDALVKQALAETERETYVYDEGRIALKDAASAAASTPTHARVAG